MGAGRPLYRRTAITNRLCGEYPVYLDPVPESELLDTIEEFLAAAGLDRPIYGV